jgi:hypothetical protein
VEEIVDEAVAHGDKYIALAPSSIKTAVRHQIAYFKHIKANHYSTDARASSLPQLVLRGSSGARKSA